MKLIEANGRLAVHLTADEISSIIKTHLLNQGYAPESEVEYAMLIRPHELDADLTGAYIPVDPQEWTAENTTPSNGTGANGIAKRIKTERTGTMTNMPTITVQSGPRISEKRAADIRRAVRDFKEGLLSGNAPIPGEFERTMKAVKRWSIERKLHEADPVKQMLKLTEETGELAAAIARDNTAEMMDAVGDIMVVLTILCQQTGINLTAAFEEAYQTIKNRNGKTVNGVFVKEEDLK